MSLSDKIIKSITKETCIEGITNFAKNKKSAPFQILDSIMPYERKIRSVVGGLETSLGSTFWEPLSRRLAKNNNFIVKNHKDLLKPLCSNELKSKITNITERRVAIDGVYDAYSSKEAIKDLCSTFIDNPICDWEKPPPGTGVDIWIEKDGINYLYDTKTVQPNLGSLKGYLRQIHEWYFYYYSKYPKGEVVAKIIFPYNPYAVDFYIKCINQAKPLEYPYETNCGAEFWNFLTDNNESYEIILKTIKKLGDENYFSNLLKKMFI